MITEDSLSLNEGRSLRDIAEHVAEMAACLADSIAYLNDTGANDTEDHTRTNVGCFTDEVASEIVYLAMRVRAGQVAGHEFLSLLSDAVRWMEAWRLDAAR